MVGLVVQTIVKSSLSPYRRIFSRFERLDVTFIGFIRFALIARSQLDVPDQLPGATKHEKLKVPGLPFG